MPLHLPWLSVVSTTICCFFCFFCLLVICLQLCRKHLNVVAVSSCLALCYACDTLHLYDHILIKCTSPRLSSINIAIGAQLFPSQYRLSSYIILQYIPLWPSRFIGGFSQEVQLLDSDNQVNSHHNKSSALCCEQFITISV